ncbi:hypothetical protein CDAR_25432 [Caerostris darwini]|uniref:Uncharacterized protein n=1 Tax=Caerostris darwini TaxID=1538125 RepID=A0AAV4RZE6_9ARAC|nr:hypothetical protein CDAR_25432 [Caerostris darwini]
MPGPTIPVNMPGPTITVNMPGPTSITELQQGASTSELQQQGTRRMLNFNIRSNGSSQTFYPRRSNEIKPNVLKRAMNTFDEWAKCLKTEGDVDKLALLTEEEYDVIRITEIGERVAENSSRCWK